MKKIKLTFIIASLQYGGSEISLALLVNDLIQKNFDILIILTSQIDIKTPHFIHPKVKIKHLNFHPAKNLLDFFLKSFKKLLKLRETIKKNESDIIIAIKTSTNISTILTTYGLSTPVILKEVAEFDFPSWPWKTMRRLFYPKASHLIWTKPSDAKRCNFIKNQSVIPSGINAQPHSPILSRKKIILVVARLIPLKQVDQIIQVFSKINHPDYALWILGDGPERNKLEALTHDLDMNKKVKFFGFQKNTALYYQQARILVGFSQTEGLSCVLLEGLSSGCATICPKYDGLQELFQDKKHLIFIPANDKKALEFELNQLMNDENLQQKLSCGAKNTIEQEYNVSVIAKKWENLIEKILKTKKI